MNLKIKDKKEGSNLILFSLGQLISVFGSSIYTFAIGLYVLKFTGSSLSFATTLTFGLVATIIFNPIAGVLADRFDKKRLVVIMDLLNGVLFLGVYFISLKYGLDLKLIYASTFLTTVFTTVFGISLETAKPNIASDKNLMNINSISRVINSMSIIMGPMIGGMVFSFINMQTFIFINGISFIISGISEMFIDFKYNYKEKQIEKKIEFIKDVKEGLEYLRNKKDMIGICIMVISLNFFISFSVTVPLPYIINNVLRLEASEFGIIESSFPVGMILGALCVKKIIEKISYKKLLIFISIGLSITMILIGIPTLINIKFNYLIYYVIVMIIFGVGISLIDIPIMFLLQKVVPEEFRGRVLSISLSLGKLSSPIGLMLAGVLLNKISSYVLTIVGGIVFLIVNILILKFSNIEKLNNRLQEKDESNIVEQQVEQQVEEHSN